MYRKYLKRTLDILISLAALLLLSPILIVVFILVWINLGKPAIFKHKRPGKDEEIFTLYKFRSMTDDRDAEGNLLPDEVRLTRFGRLLRATSLDELPELFNILKGDMSIVGPRPLEVYFLPYYNEKEKHRHDVRPGLTGLAQVNGRNNLTWEQRFAYDLEYLEHISFANDFRILLQTVTKVLKSEGTGIPVEDFNVYRTNQIRAVDPSGETRGK
jgi:lipopolysaccharide/colanic/teichoic acid biosynthesis glycosyltransferase